MSARALMDDDVKIVEVDMAYHERIGDSKLHVDFVTAFASWS